MNQSKSISKNGFTLVELLVVIAIIGILIGMLLPAVQQVREAARRTNCMNQIRQISLAALNFESAHMSFPAGAEHVNAAEPDDDNDPESSGWGWRTKLLPFIEQAPLFQSLDLDQDVNSSANAPLVVESIANFICPSNQEMVGATTNSGTDQSMSSYLGNGGSIEWSIVPWRGWSDGILTRTSDDRHLGITISQISDGTSNTFFCGETVSYALLKNINDWIWDPAFFAASNGGSAARTLSQVRTGHGLLNPEISEPDPVLRNSFASLHPGGAVFAFVDGSTHFIGDEIEHNDPVLNGDQWEDGKPRTTYQRLFSRNDGVPVGDF